MADLPTSENFSGQKSPIVCKLPRMEKIQKLRAEFKSKFGEEQEPKFYARAPGRVNLIGEHIDYHGYGVLPMALDQDILIACAVNDSGKLELANKNFNYPDFTCNVSDIVINKSKPEWYNYVLCGLKGIYEHCSLEKPKGMKMMLEGSVPRSAGLSSSSAIVCASALTAAFANEKYLSKTELASICTWSEKYVGTEGGGMDQSISCLAEEGTAKLINFDPLTATSVKLPAKSVFVVTNSCVELNKAATSHFNTRVLEGQLGVKILAKHHGLDWNSLKKMKQLQEELKMSFEDLISETKKIIHTDSYSREEICKLFSMSDEEFISSVLNEKTKHLQSFKVLERTLHVLTESQRVLKFKEICDGNDSNALEQLGKLMNESHASCRDFYECSCTELDQLTEVCRKSGALGSRLTGAGWAGCAVSLVHANDADNFLNKVREDFYKARGLECSPAVMFISEPSDGVCIYPF